MNKSYPTERAKQTYTKVSSLYESSVREMGRWMWDNHVQWVANKALIIAKKYNADIEKTYIGALLHDLGDVWMERNDQHFDDKSEEEAKQILKSVGMKKNEIQFVLKDIVEPHSCHPGNLPSTLEGKALASADAMFHLQTNFFIQFAWMHVPQGKDFKEWLLWVSEKIERDFNNKIFFDDEKAEIKPDYEALKRIFVKQ